jgi:hypothetical protein
MPSLTGRSPDNDWLEDQTSQPAAPFRYLLSQKRSPARGKNNRAPELPLRARPVSGWTGAAPDNLTAVKPESSEAERPGVGLRLCTGERARA